MSATQHIEIPSFDDRQSMWAAVDFTRIPGQFPAVEQFLDEIKTLYANGKVEHSVFTLPSHPVLDWYLNRNQFHEVGFFEKFWRNQGAREAFPHRVHDINFFDSKIFSFCSPFLLGGKLAWMLSSGGAYHQFPRGGIEAKRIGEEAAFELLGFNYDHAYTFECGIAWSEFFHDVAWDHTFIIIDKQKRIIHTLLATDTD